MRIAALSISALLLVPPAEAQDTIRIQTRLVEVDVIVRNGNGPVAGLTKEDFTLFDNGKPRTIDLFAVASAPPQPSAPGNRSGLKTAAKAAPNEAQRTPTIILVDRLNTAVAEQVYGKQQLSRFLRSQWRGEPVAIYALDSTLHVIQEFTGDAKQLNAAVSNLGSERVVNAPTVDLRVQKTLSAWTTIARHVADTPGRKNLVWLSSGFPMCYTADRRMKVCFDSDIDKAARVLNEARVALYPVDARGLRAASYESTSRAAALANATAPVTDTSVDMFMAAASSTGGLDYHNTNDLGMAIRSAIDDSEIVYTLGFYLTEESLDGVFHKIRVETSDKNTTLRYRSGYLASKDSGPTAQQRRSAFIAALSSPLESLAIGLRATAQEDPARPGTYQVVVSINANDVRLERNGDNWLGAVETALVWQPSPSNKTAIEPVPIVLTDEQFQDALKRSLLWRQTVNGAPAAKFVRIVVQDQATGAVGTVSVAVRTN